jgi:DNA primase
MAVCPFHQEKTPSLSIDGARGLYNCFGCGKSGDVFRWVQEANGLDFREAVEFLARRAGVTLTEEPGAQERRGRREELVKATEAALEFFHERLKTSSDGGTARSYLRGRGYDAEVVSRYLIGWAPDEWDTLTRHLQARRFSQETLVVAGLSQKSSRGRLIDRFRGRVVFPIHDLRGDPVGFGARLLEGDGPKYLNSPETPIYHKSRLLYGLHWAKSDIVRQGEAVVVEGYTDVIGYALAGMPVAVATCGTALGEDHLDLLRRFTERVVLAFDADEAGAGAALRGFERSVPGDLDLRVAALPPGSDPADLVFDGRVEELRKATGESMPLLQFRIERELARFDLMEAEARGRAVNAVAEVVARHPDAVVRHEYAVLISRRTGVDLPVVEAAVARAARRSATEASPPPRQQRPLTGEEKAELELLRLVMANDPQLRALQIDPEHFSDPEHRAAFERLWAAVEPLTPGDPPNLGALIGGGDAPEDGVLRRLALEPRPLIDAEGVVNRLKEATVRRRIDSVRAELEGLDPDEDPQGYSDRFAELIALERQLRELRSDM